MNATIDRTSDSAARIAPASERDDARWRGWFYRALAVDPTAAVLAPGAPYVRNWFADADTEPAALSRTAPARSYAMVILHGTLGGCASVADAFRAAHARLDAGGLAVMAGRNRLRGRPAAQSTDVPAATPWGYRRAARSAGFGDVALYLARPGLDRVDCVVASHEASARAFFRLEVAMRRASGRIDAPALRALLARTGVERLLDRYLIAVARKC